MPQQDIWDAEYRNPHFITGYNEPQSCVLRFYRYLKKQHGVRLGGLTVLDLGSGTGRNAFYLAEREASVTGIEISPTAVSEARKRAAEHHLNINYIQGSIGEAYPLEKESIDLILDVTSSNSLLQAEREVYLAEMHRVLRPGGFVFVRALCKDADKNAQTLLHEHPGPELDTYIMPLTHICERVFSRDDFIATYSPLFKILELKKETSYTRFNGQSYKRNFWVSYIQKKV